MSFCMQPDGRSAHICRSKAAGVKTPKHPLHRCLDFSVMRYGDGRSRPESRDGPCRPMGAPLRDDCGAASVLYLPCGGHMLAFTPKQTGGGGGEEAQRDGAAMQQTRQRCGDGSSPPVLSVFLKTFLLSAVFLSGSVVFPSSKTKSLDWEDKYGGALHRPTLTSQRTRVPFSD